MNINECKSESEILAEYNAKVFETGQLRKRVAELEAALETAQRQAAAMRSAMSDAEDALTEFGSHSDDTRTGIALRGLDAAAALSVGRDFVPRSELERATRCIAELTAGQSPMLSGEWRHSNGMLFCGTLRIAKMDFDTDPSAEMCSMIFDDICCAMNAKASDFVPRAVADKLAAACSMMEKWLEMDNGDDKEIEELTMQTVCEHVAAALAEYRKAKP